MVVLGSNRGEITNHVFVIHWPPVYSVLNTGNASTVVACQASMMKSGKQVAGGKKEVETGCTD